MEARVDKTGHRWEIDLDGAHCTGEAYDANGDVIARVTISLSFATHHDYLKTFSSETPAEFKTSIERQAEHMARQLGDLTSPSGSPTNP